MRIGTILTPTYTDGPGERVSLYTAGCSIRCPGCQNPHLFKSTPEQERDVYAVAQQLIDARRPISILGGEPFDQSYELALLLTYIGCGISQNPWVRPIMVYTGYRWEHLVERASRDPRERWALDCVRESADILVDGPFDLANTDQRIQYRGSYNQRVIDLAAMRRVPSSLIPIVRDWDGLDSITVDGQGRIIASASVMEELSQYIALDDVTAERACGAAPRGTK